MSQNLPVPMRFLTIFFFATVATLGLFAQSNQGLVTHISFNKNGCAIEDEAGDPDIRIYPNGDSTCSCGVSQNSRYLDGDDDWFYLFGDDVEETFSTIDFTLSFYFKPILSSNAPNQVLFSKRTGCASDVGFFIRYNTVTRNINVTLSENATISTTISENLPFSCWYHVVVVRKDKTTTLYVNNEKRKEANAAVRVNISNSQPLTVGDSDCNLDESFQGYFDEIRLYSRALSFQDVGDLYFSPDQILTGLKPNGVNESNIFIGESVTIALSETCADVFEWTPTTDVSAPDQPTPTMSPSQTTTYTLKMLDNDNCPSTDSIRIVVYDKDNIKCGDILLPSAFTPNGEGPTENEDFGISNIFAVGELLSFEVFDRWGNIVFYSNDVRGRWDGNYKGQPVNPGVFLYKLRYVCEGEENVKSGNVTVIR